jgi:hypothetical protein
MQGIASRPALFVNVPLGGRGLSFIVPVKFVETPITLHRSQKKIV